jgi:3-hydroxyacyl-[acyl-carrier-protein] dehydratase
LFFGIILLAILTRALIRDDTFRKFGKFKMYNRPFRDATMTDQPNPAPETIDIGGILKLLPHRYPLLLIDRVIEIVRAKRIVAIKNVTINEQFFVGHFPGYPIMPGVLIVEAMAQAGAALLFTEVTDRDDKLLVFTGIERARFRRPVTPGDQLRIEVDVLAFRGTAGRLQGKAYVDGKLACEAVVTCRLLQRPKAQATEAVPATDTPEAS